MDKILRYNNFNNVCEFKNVDTLYIFDFDNTLVKTPSFNKVVIDYLNEDIKYLLDNSLNQIGKNISDLNIDNGRIYINDPNININISGNWVRKGNRVYIVEPTKYLNDIISLPTEVNDNIYKLYNRCRNKAIVTARPESSRQMIVDTMNNLEIEYPNYGLFMYPNGNDNQRKWKSKTIFKLIKDSSFSRVRFYDDKSKVVREVNKHIKSNIIGVDFKSIKYKNIDMSIINEIKLSKVAKRSIKDGFTILVGKNAMMNDILSLKIANDEDIWLHASKVPGSHVIIINDKNIEIPNDVIQFAAELAVKNSKAKNKIDVPVVVTKAKNIGKSPGMAPGKVNVNYKDSYILNISI